MDIKVYNYPLDIYQSSRRDTREWELTVYYKINTAKNRYKETGAGQGEINPK